MRRVELIYISANIFHGWLNEDSWILISASAVSCDMLFSLKFMKKIWLLRYIVGKGGVFKIIADILLWCNTKIQQVVVFKRLVAMWNLKLKFIDLSCTLSVFYPCISNFKIGHLENTGSLSYTDLPSGDIFHYTIQKTTFINITTDLIRKKSLLEKCQDHSDRYKLNKIQILTWILIF